MVTQEQIDNAIENCKWKKDMCGIDICRCGVLPCSHVIEKGLCYTLIELFKENNND